jgi:hypothetical protein
METMPTKKIFLENSSIQKMLKMILAMIAFEPVIANIIAICLASGILFLLSHPSLLPAMGKYHAYLTYTVYALILIQTMKSAMKSLFIPLAFLIISAIGFLALSQNPDWHFISIGLLKEMMLLSIVGGAVSVFVIK